MKFIDTIKDWMGAVLPAAPLPKAPKGQQGFPGYRNSVKAKTSALPRSDRRLAVTNRLEQARTASDTKSVVRLLSKGSPDLSSAISFLLRTGIPEKFSVVSRDMDGKINPESTKLAHELLRRMTYIGNVDGSFTSQLGLQSLSEQLAMELVLDGAACLEVSLDKARIPAAFNPISVPTLKFYEEDKGFRMVQVVGGDEINLDLPTVIYVAVDQLQSEAYPASYVESAVQPIMADLDFNNDVRKALKRAVLPRLKASIDSEKIKKMTPPEILADAEKFTTYKNQLISEVETVINGLDPDDALVSYDSIDFGYIDGGHDPSSIIERVQKVMNGKLAAGAKTLPVILGHGITSNASSTESLLYLKQANMLRVKLNEIYSRALTVAIRLMGQDAYVEFVYEDIDLRPKSELETFKSVKQSRVLELLSLGLISDEEACIELTGNLPPDGYKPLSGTMFKGSSAAVPANPASNTAVERTLTSSAPKGVKSQNRKTAEVEQFEEAVERMHEASMETLKTVADSMSKLSDKKVEVEVKPQELHLTLAKEEQEPSAKTVRIVRDANGVFTHAEVLNA